MDRQFEATRQPLLGQLIVDSVQEEARLEATAQERIGFAVVRYAVAQASSQQSAAASQSQLASAVVASIRSNALQERLNRLVMLDGNSTDLRTAVSHRRVAPDIEYGYLLAACAVLIALFVGALSFVRRRPEEEAMPIWKVETLLRLARSAG
jgi:hypothetical protein